MMCHAITGLSRRQAPSEVVDRETQFVAIFAGGAISPFGQASPDTGVADEHVEPVGQLGHLGTPGV
jgi:hypothetical protein